MNIKEEHTHKTTFWTRYGNYEFTVVPFELTSALATFVFLVNNILSPYLEKFVLIFMDNILMYSKNKDDHEKHLTVVLQLLRENKIYVKVNKCEFYQTQI